MKVTIEFKNPVYITDQQGEKTYVHTEVRACVETPDWSSCSSFAVDLPESATDEQIRNWILSQYGNV